MGHTWRHLSLLSFIQVLFGVRAFHPAGYLVQPFWNRHGQSVAVHRSSKVVRSAHALNTAFEFLADERCMRDAAYKGLHWFDPTQSIDHPTSLAVEYDDDNNDDDSCLTLPLYPLSATYLPAVGVNHTLNNVQPRNIRMALDLAAAPTQDQRFCVTLNTVDTGRLALTGVIMRVLQVQPAEVDGTVVRVTVTCVCEEIVRILRVENPDAARLENRIRKSDEYLNARVQVQPYPTTTSTTGVDSGGGGDKKQQLCQPANMIAHRLVDDYNAVRGMYLSGTGKNDLPPFALATLAKDLPALTTVTPEESLSWLTTTTTDATITTSTLFWQTAQVWQTLCYTVREGRQMRLSVDRNEIMIAAAMKKGGPLKLPVHMEDLGPADRRQLEEMEVEAQREWVELGLDPCLDFQVLLTLGEAEDRIAFLAQMIARERQRLEQVARQPVAVVEETAVPEPQRKGAWFDEY
jgi:hypothetical protein